LVEENACHPCPLIHTDPLKPNGYSDINIPPGIRGPNILERLQSIID
jgi:hypothetical protein